MLMGCGAEDWNTDDLVSLDACIPCSPAFTLTTGDETFKGVKFSHVWENNFADVDPACRPFRNKD